MKKVGLHWYAFLGGLIGSVLASWLAPKGIAWYFDPPVDIGVNCKAATEWSMRNLQKAQLGGLILGLIVGGAIGFMIWKKNRKTISKQS